MSLVIARPAEHVALDGLHDAFEEGSNVRRPMTGPARSVGCSRCSPNASAIVVAHYYLGLTQDEIAGALGIRRGTVSATVSQSLARMRKEGMSRG